MSEKKDIAAFKLTTAAKEFVPKRKSVDKPAAAPLNPSAKEFVPKSAAAAVTETVPVCHPASSEGKSRGYATANREQDGRACPR